jgi:hypothetical protein
VDPGGGEPGEVDPGGGGPPDGVEPGGVAVESDTVVMHSTMRSNGLSGHRARP